jgi:ABC-type molybdenum transport system ATPase subunit/photorepair protein PhrA
LPFELEVPRNGRDALLLSISPGDVLFILGANGTGKSSLMHRLYKKHYAKARRITAHRQTWLQSGAITLTAHSRQQVEINIVSQDRQDASRWSDTYSSQRPNIALFDLIESENIRARGITRAVDRGDIDLAKQLSADQSPLAVINELLRLSNLPIVISVNENGQLLASKSDSKAYEISELSDGERNAVLIASNVLTAKPGTLLLIDEPERHLHRSIISPLLTQVFAKRPDCAFAISTHEVMLPLDNPNSKTLMLRSCDVDGRSVSAWDADFAPIDAEIDEDLKKDILGARRKMLFVEGVEGSLDKPLYSVVFPNVSVLFKGICRNVVNAVSAIRNTDNLHWLHAFGIVDNDGRSHDEIQSLKARGVYALELFSVESVYYHPEVQRAATERHAEVTGEDALERVAEAKAKAMEAIRPHAQRLSERRAERLLREEVFKHIPGKAEVAALEPITIDLDIPGVVAAERAKLDKATEANELIFIIGRYPVRETGALRVIATELGFKDQAQYESTVRRLLMDDKEALDLVRSFFGTLAADIGAE